MGGCIICCKTRNRAAIFVFPPDRKSIKDVIVDEVNEIYRGYQRPSWAYPVYIWHDLITDNPHQIWRVRGVVVPISTTDRPSTTPNPFNGYPTGGNTGLDAGHVLGLANGGVNNSLDIVPQQAAWQQSGGWRRMEKICYYAALKAYRWSTAGSASRASSLPDPWSSNCPREVFYITMNGYDARTGAPTSYQGSVTFWYSNGNYNEYPFTILPNHDANWTSGLPPTLISLEEIDKEIELEKQQREKEEKEKDKEQ